MKRVRGTKRACVAGESGPAQRVGQSQGVAEMKLRGERQFGEGRHRFGASLTRCLLAPLALSVGVVMLTDVRAADDLRVVIIRHGEKPANGDNLSCQGLNRALALPDVLAQKFGKPDFTYVPALKLGKESKHARMFQTVTPFAVQQDLTINSRYAESDVAGLARDVVQRSGLVLIVWEHSQIPPLAKALGIQRPPEWSGEDFDSIWIIRLASGKATMSVDAEGIAPSAQCSN